MTVATRIRRRQNPTASTVSLSSAVSSASGSSSPTYVATSGLRALTFSNHLRPTQLLVSLIQYRRSLYPFVAELFRLPPIARPRPSSISPTNVVCENFRLRPTLLSLTRIHRRVLSVPRTSSTSSLPALSWYIRLGLVVGRPTIDQRSSPFCKRTTWYYYIPKLPKSKMGLHNINDINGITRMPGLPLF